MQVSTETEMQLNDVSDHTGTEVIGIDLSRSIDEETLHKLRQTLAKRGVLIFRNQKLDAQKFLSSMQAFGQVVQQNVARFNLPELPLVGFVSSEDTDKPGGKRLVRGEQYHTDHSISPAPPRATVLAAVTLPSRGGDTQFVNVIAGYETLPEATKRRIDPLKVLHVYKSSHSPREKPVLSEEDRAKLPETVQPLVIVHPENGSKALYMNTAHMERIIGMPDEEALPLIAELMEHATQPRFEYRHKWRAGDVVMWDNRSVMHQANADYDPAEKRFLYRVILAGSQLEGAQ